jgi:hypothetical protein
MAVGDGVGNLLLSEGAPLSFVLDQFGKAGPAGRVTPPNAGDTAKGPLGNRLCDGRGYDM